MFSKRLRILKGLFKVTSYASLAVATGSSLYVLHNNEYDVSSIGLVRFGRAFVAATRIVIDYKYSLYNLDETSEKYHFAQSAVHKRSAEKLLKLACSNGGVWIKVGQHCGALEYLLPPEYVKTLSILHSKAPQSPFEDVCKVIRQDLSPEHAEELIEHMEKTSIGAASLAQVHKARFRDGSILAVKVQHRRVKPHSFVDCTTMEGLIRCVAVLFPEFNLMWLVEETKKNIPVELDFINEGQNADRVRRTFHHLSFLKIPEIRWDYSTDRVLVMEFCEGGEVTDINYMRDNGIKPAEVCRKLGQLYSEMIFVQGTVHCDPHPGNVLVHQHPRKGLQIVLLDHGLYTTLDEDFRLHYSNLWLALINADLEGIKKASHEMNVGHLHGLFACMLTARSWKSVLSGIDKNSLTSDESAEIKKYVGTYLPQISEVLGSVPRPMLLILKTNDLLRGIEFALKVQLGAHSFLQMSKCCVKAVHEYAITRCDSTWGRMKLQVSEWWSLLRIRCFEVFLNLSAFTTHLRFELMKLDDKNV